MSLMSQDFEIHLPTNGSASAKRKNDLQKFSTRLLPGKTEYRLEHNLGTEDVLVQTRIAGHVREGGIRILDENTVLIQFGGPLHEPMDVVIIG